MIIIKDARSEYRFRGPESGRLDLSIGRCGYLTVYENNSCVYKNALDEISEVKITTDKANISFRPKEVFPARPEGEKK